MRAGVGFWVWGGGGGGRPALLAAGGVRSSGGVPTAAPPPPAPAPPGNPRVAAGLQPAAASELEALLDKAAAVARAVGARDQESHGGGNQGNHGRRRQALGHIRAVMARAKANTWVRARGARRRRRPGQPARPPALLRLGLLQPRRARLKSALPATSQEVRSLHGLATATLKALGVAEGGGGGGGGAASGSQGGGP